MGTLICSFPEPSTAPELLAALHRYFFQLHFMVGREILIHQTQEGRGEERSELPLLLSFAVRFIVLSNNYLQIRGIKKTDEGTYRCEGRILARGEINFKDIQVIVNGEGSGSEQHLSPGCCCLSFSASSSSAVCCGNAVQCSECLPGG